MDQAALVVHGLYDTVTPYFESKRLLNMGWITESVQGRITERYYAGGHMFYSWQTSQAQFKADVEAFIQTNS